MLLSTASAIRDAALAGLGPALLPDWLITPDMGAGRLVDVFPTYSVTATVSTPAHGSCTQSAYLPNKVRVMIDFLKVRLGSAPKIRSRRR